MKCKNVDYFLKVGRSNNAIFNATIFLSKVNDKMSFKAAFVRLIGLFTPSCAARALHAIIILRNSFGLKPRQVCVIYSFSFNVCNFQKLQKDVL